MPYLHCDTADSNKIRSATVKWVTEGRDPATQPQIPNEPEYINSRIIARYLQPGAHYSDGGNLHFRRSLHQYYYATQAQTYNSDIEQVALRYTREKERALKKKPVLIMVDQLWMWVLQDAIIRKL